MLTVCYFGTYRHEYARNQVMIEGLRRNGVTVLECHEPLWRGIEDRVRAASGGWKKPGFALRVLGAWARLWRRHARLPPYDAMVLGYPAPLDVVLARRLCRRGRPLVMDAFMSTYLIAVERGLVERHPCTGRLLHGLERRALRRADLIIQDTPEYQAWMEREFGVDPARIRLVPTGADDRLFQPRAAPPPDPSVFRVLYYGTFIANHGVAHVVDAAARLRDDPSIRFELIGDGPERAAAEARLRERGLTNVEVRDWVDKARLPERIAAADVCLGAFGTTPQSLMTIQNKIYECMAMRRPVLTGDSPAVRRELAPGRQVCLCGRADPASLAQAIRALRADPALCARIAEGGHAYFRGHATIERIGARFKQHLEEACARPRK